MIHRYRGGSVPARVDGGWWTETPRLVGEALAAFDFRRAVGAVWRVIDEANRYVEATRLWQLPAVQRDAVLGRLLGACHALGEWLVPFVPVTAGLVAVRWTPVDGVLPQPWPVFPRVRPVFPRIG
jgi:methionyl-tRNA synthetase